MASPVACGLLPAVLPFSVFGSGALLYPLPPAMAAADMPEDMTATGTAPRHAGPGKQALERAHAPHPACIGTGATAATGVSVPESCGCPM